VWQKKKTTEETRTTKKKLYGILQKENIEDEEKKNKDRQKSEGVQLGLVQ
jgi:hypothetical protein